MPGRRAAFTLLEVLVAVSIFAIISVAIYSTFRIGLKSYEKGRDQMEVIQSARVAIDLLSRDLRSLYYLSPEQYNRNLIQQAQRLAVQQMQEDQGTRGIRGRRGAGRLPRPGEEEEEERLKGIPIDLAIVGEDSEDYDTLTFVTSVVDWGRRPISGWGLKRVKYSVDEEGNLFRVEGPIWTDELPEFQFQPPEDPEEQRDRNRRNEPPAVEPPMSAEDAERYLENAPRELLARNVKVFDLQYGYWTEDGWFETNEWISHQRQYRHPPIDIDPRDPRYQNLMNLYQAQPSDMVPAYVAVTLKIGSPDDPDSDRGRLFRTRIRLPGSSETFISPESLLSGFNAGGVPPTGGYGQTPFGASGPPRVRR